VLVACVAVALAALAATRTVTGRRFLMDLAQPGAQRAAAASPTDLLPVFDGPDTTRPRIPVRLVPVVHGVEQPTDVGSVPGHPEIAVVLSKLGTAWIADLGAGTVRKWFEVEVETGVEMGLLGLAFSPSFATDETFYVHSNPPGMKSRIARWVGWERPLEVAVVLEVDQPYKNHNAGQIQFGPDGMLYVGFGDGGFRADPHGHGQNRATMLGSMLRLDVSEGEGYRVPPDNPFLGVDGVRPETWAYGLRNPWRYSFDPRGRMVVADVGQNKFEEIDLVGRGDDLGWNVREADHCFQPETGCRTEGLVDPIWSYGRNEGISVTGGVVWTAPGPLQGKYLFADYGTGRLWALDLPDTVQRVASVTSLGRFQFEPTAFGRAPDGSVWVCDFRSGAVYRIVVAET
jgi:glucose/arabinose dehydrogenase